MVHHDQKGIEPGRNWKICNEVARDLVEGKGGGGGNGVTGRHGWMCVHLVLLASGTASNKGMDKGSEAWPPKLGSNQLSGFKEARMSCGCVIMTTAENITVEITSRWDVDAAPKSEDTVNVLPVG